MKNKSLGVGLAVCLSGCMLSGCESGSVQNSANEQMPAEIWSAPEETEAETVLYESETETDIFGEVMLHSIWDVYPEHVREWAGQFDETDVASVLYRTYMEGEPDDHVIRNPQIIRQLFDAISRIQVGGSLNAPSLDGDVMIFTMKDGSEQAFVFSMGCVKVDNAVYETTESDQLWDLTADILYGPEDSQTEY